MDHSLKEESAFLKSVVQGTLKIIIDYMITSPYIGVKKQLKSNTILILYYYSLI